MYTKCLGTALSLSLSLSLSTNLPSRVSFAHSYPGSLEVQTTSHYPMQINTCNTCVCSHL